jgi:hypothetical protein
MGIKAAILLMRASRSVGRGERAHKRGDADGARTSFRRAIDLVDAAGALGPLGLSIQIAAIQGVIENSASPDVGQAVRPAVEKVLACFDKDSAWRASRLAADWEKWARAFLQNAPQGAMDATVTPTSTMGASELVRLELAKRFSPDDVGPATAALEALSLQVGDSTGGRDRIHLAAVLRSGGSVSALRDAIALAQIDWRDLLVAAGLGNSDWREVLRRHGMAIP